MSWSLGGSNNAAQAVATSAQAQTGPDLEFVETERLVFQLLASKGALKLLPLTWPSEQPPPVSANLLSIAPNRGLLAAASPNTLILASTERVRAEIREGGAGDGQTRSYTPQATLDIPRVSHLNFTADESHLVIAAEQGGGLAVYEVQNLLNGGKESAFQISTNGVSIRHLVPSPARSTSEQIAVVLTTGQLLLASLHTRTLAKTSQNQPIFAENVYTVAWSRLGKQLVCGRLDGTAIQIATDGSVKANIPAPPNLPSPTPCTSIFWLDTYVFLTNHGPVETPTDGDLPDPPTWHLVLRNKSTGTAEFRMIQDPVPAVPDARLPPHYYMQRLREWAPGLEDCILLACSGCADLGLVTKSQEPLQPQHDNMANIVGQYTATSTSDTKRASLPMSTASSPDSMDAGGETYPLGFCIDASVSELVDNPITGEDGVARSSKPLPLVMALNNEGILQAWWMIYESSVRQGTSFPGSVAAGLGEQGTFQQNVSSKPAQNTPQQPSQPSVTTTPFNSNTNSTASAFGQARGGALGGGLSSNPSFGGASMLGQKSSPWGGPGSQKSTFGQPAFGQSSFGQPSTSLTPTPSTGSTTFGQPGATFGSGLSSGGGFAALAAKGPAGENTFASSTTQQNGTQQAPQPQSGGSGLFGVQTEQNVGQSSNTAGSQTSKSVFGSTPVPNSSSMSPFGSLAEASTNQGFSSFGALGKATPDQQKPVVSQFGAPKQETSFGSTATVGSGSGGSTIGLNTPAVSGGSFGKPSVSREETMEEAKPTDKIPESVLGGAKTGFSFTDFKLGSTFKGDGTAKDDLPKPKDGGASAFNNMFGDSLDTSKRPDSVVKREPGTDEPRLADIPEAKAEDAPLPPDPTSAKAKAALKALEADAPLPPDPTTAKAKAALNALEKDSPFAPGLPSKEVSDKSEPPIAGSPPVDLGKEQFSPHASTSGDADGSGVSSDNAGPAEDDDDSGDWEEDDDSGDNEDEDTASEPNEQRRTALSAFEARISPASPKKTAAEARETTTPDTLKKSSEGSALRKSYTPTGFPAGMQDPEQREQIGLPKGMPQPPVNFQPPPSAARESPRSPSPTRPIARPGNRNVTSPSRLGQGAKPAPQQQAPMPPLLAHPPAQKTIPARSLLSSSTQTAVEPPKPAQIPQYEPGIDDPAHEHTMRMLRQSLEPDKNVPDFIAHSNHVGASNKQGLAGSLEKVFRDINSMLDTLGLNAHRLAGFLDTHVELTRDDRTRYDLEGDSQDWCLDEVADLGVLQREVSTQLSEGQLEDVAKKVSQIKFEEEEHVRVRRKAVEVRTCLRAHTDPTLQQRQALQPLPRETATQQGELREGVKKVQTLLAEVEAQIGELRAELASVSAASVESTQSQHIPTVEAVENTIRKMTAMIEKKSADIDVLGSRMRRLPLSIRAQMASLDLNGDYEVGLASAMSGSKMLDRSVREGSTFATPPPSIGRKRFTAQGDPLGMSGMLGSRFRTPPSTSMLRFDPGTSTNLSSSVSARKKMQDVTSEEVDAFYAKAHRRQQVFAALKTGVEARKGKRTIEAS